MKKVIKISLVLFIMVLCSSAKQIVPDVIYINDWKIKNGDNLNWSKTDFVDTDWENLYSGLAVKSLDKGYTWYRKSFDLPNEMLNQSFFKDSIKIQLGKGEEIGEMYLNGHSFIKNGVLVNENDKARFKIDHATRSPKGFYVIPANDKRIMWGEKNSISLRIQNTGGGEPRFVNMSFSICDLKDYIKIDDVKSSYQIINDRYSKTVFVNNKSYSTTIYGKFYVTVIDAFTGKNYLTQSWNVILKPGFSDSYSFEFDKMDHGRLVVTYTFVESKGKNTLVQSQDFPYILTPKTAVFPRINGPQVFGVRPGSPFLFRIPTTGIRPMIFSVENLPEGLILDHTTGIITGMIRNTGVYKVTLLAKNEKGENKREFRIVVGDKLALTPPMGWNSWNVWGVGVDNDKVKAATDVFITSGLADRGYNYINIDDGWEASSRNSNGDIVTNEKFPDLKVTSDYVHSKGLRFGIYSSPGTKTCGGYLGSYQHELQDAETYSKWGVDYLKYDWCSYSDVCPDLKNLDEQKKPYRLISDCLKKQPRDIVLSMCQYGMGDVWKWGGSVGGNSWRTTYDIEDTWECMKDIGFYQSVASRYAKPGNFNDPDMLVVGWVGWGPKLRVTRLTASEQYTHISLWALLSAPLLIGCDLTRLDDFTMNLLGNNEVIDIDQDALVKSAVPVIKDPLYEVWVKELEDGSKAIGIFNLDTKEKTVSVDWTKLGIEGKQVVRDVWRQKNIGSFDTSFETTVLPHGVTLIKVTKE